MFSYQFEAEIFWQQVKLLAFKVSIHFFGVNLLVFKELFIVPLTIGLFFSIIQCLC